MQIQELGELTTPVMVFGGPYSNFQATRALRRLAKNTGLSRDQVICTGDVVAYCAQASDTVAEMRDWGIPVVAGNCEKQLAAGAQECGCGFASGTACDLLSGAWFAHASSQASAADRIWMAACPDVVTFSIKGRRGAVIHGGVTDISRFLWSVSPQDMFRDEIRRLHALVGAVDLVLAGHSGIPFLRQIDQVLWVNAGAIGLPPNDGSPQTRFAVIHEPDDIRIETLDYDHEGAFAAMSEAGLTQGYDQTLKSGWWPSEDVLPAQLRRHSDANG